MILPSNLSKYIGDFLYYHFTFSRCNLFIIKRNAFLIIIIRSFTNKNSLLRGVKRNEKLNVSLEFCPYALCLWVIYGSSLLFLTRFDNPVKTCTRRDWLPEQLYPPDFNNLAFYLPCNFNILYAECHFWGETDFLLVKRLVLLFTYYTFSISFLLFMCR